MLIQTDMQITDTETHTITTEITMLHKDITAEADIMVTTDIITEMMSIITTTAVFLIIMEATEEKCM